MNETLALTAPLIIYLVGLTLLLLVGVAGVAFYFLRR